MHFTVYLFLCTWFFPQWGPKLTHSITHSISMLCLQRKSLWDKLGWERVTAPGAPRKLPLQCGDLNWGSLQSSSHTNNYSIVAGNFLDLWIRKWHIVYGWRCTVAKRHLNLLRTSSQRTMLYNFRLSCSSHSCTTVFRSLFCGTNCNETAWLIVYKSAMHTNVW